MKARIYYINRKVRNKVTTIGQFSSREEAAGALDYFSKGWLEGRVYVSTRKSSDWIN